MTQALAHLAPPPAGRRHAPIDHAAAERAARALLDALGIDLSDESVRDTPRRRARMYAELLTPHAFNPTTFPNDGGYDELVVATGIPFHSMCEHHLLPFVGVAHRCAACRRRAPGPSPPPCTASCGTTRARAMSSWP